jgi:hypothetical protein
VSLPYVLFRRERERWDLKQKEWVKVISHERRGVTGGGRALFDRF